MATKHTKKEMHPYVQKAIALFVLALLFLGVASVRADGPYAVEWGIDTFVSFGDVQYNMSDLTFVWGGETGNATNLEVSGCSSVDDCLFATTYDEAGEYTVNVFARNSNGETVSNTASCTANVATQCPCSEGYTCVNNYCQYNMQVSCGAYESEDAQNFKQLHNPGGEVWWRATITGGEGPFTYQWLGDAAIQGVHENPQGPFYIATVDGNPGDYDIDSEYEARVFVTDSTGERMSATCNFYAKECAFDADCQTLGYSSVYQCSTGGQCVPPPINFAEGLAIEPGVIQEGEQCGLTWAAAYADECTLYKNNDAVVDSAIGTSTTNYMVGPGTYHVICTTAITGEEKTAGPVRCIYNPNVRES